MNPGLKEEFKNNDKSILFIGTSHENNSSFFSFLKTECDNFKPEVILVEGGFENANFENEQEAIEKGLEMGMITYYLKSKNYPLLGNDPSFSEEINFLKKEYDLDLINTYFFLRSLSFYLEKQIIPKDKVEEEVLKEINQKQQNLTLDTVKNTLKTYDLEYNISTKYFDYFNPTIKGNIFNDMTRKLGEYRDSYMIEKLKNLLKKYNKILILKGEYHLKKSREAINEIIKNAQHI